MSGCPKCNGSMAEGYVVDHSYGEKKVAAFHKGAPDKRWWGLKTTKSDTLPITTMRCGRCGYLEHYAKA